MAILKDLIVHGSSRFLNKIYAEELETSAFEAESAIIKKLKADDVTVVGLLDVQGEMHTNSWTNSNIATIDGSFYITPTIGSNSGNIVFSSVNVASLTGNFTGVDSLYIGGSSSGSTVQWTSGSKVLLTGEVEVNGQWLPLGTLLGTLSANAQTSSIGLKELKDNRHNDSSIITDIRNAIGSTSLDYRNLKISLYQRKDGNDSKPLGIYMTAMGANGKTFIDIYGGVNATTTAGSSGGFADPNLRIGNLSGLGAVEGTTPQGWGIYTTNGYFKGVIVSSAGKIGGWSIGTSGIYNGITGVTTTGSTAGTFIGTGGISNYKNTSTYVNIQDGVITAKGVNLTGQINATAGNIGGATITGGVLTVPAANVSGELTAATINGSKIIANSITAGQIAASAITADELAANAVTSAKIKAGEVKATNIASSAVTADKLDATTINASNKLTVGALTATDQNNILNSNIQVGGTNLLKNSGDLTKWGKESGLTVTWDSTVNMYKVVDTSQHTSSRWGIYQDLDIKPNTTYTFSIWGMKSEDTSITSAVGTFASSLSWPNTNGSTYTTTMSRSSVTFTSGADHVKCRIYLYLNPTADNSKTGYFYRPKLEEGNKTTDWSPAPEDIQDGIDDAAKTATTYITDIDSNKGITVKPADTSGNDYLQMNSSAINFYRNNVETLKIEDSAIRVGKLGNNLRNVYITDSAVQIRNNTSVLAEYGSSIKLYNPTKTTAAVEISSTGASFNGNVKATSLSTGTKTASTTGKGTYIDGSGNIYVGNGSTNNFTVTDTGTITATGANLLTATIGNATNKITIGTGTSGHSSIRYGMTTLADTTNNGFYIGTDGIALGKGVFKVTTAGALYCNDAHISGEITATSGQIGDLSIENGRLIFQSGARNLLKSKPVNSTQENDVTINQSGSENGEGNTRIEYSYYQLELTEELKATQAYSFQLWGVNLIGDGTTLNIYLGTNDNVILGSWSGNDFTDGYAEHLTISFTLTQTNINQASDTKYIKISSSSGTNLIINRWKLEKGNRQTDWSLAPEDIYNRIDTVNEATVEVNSSLNNYMTSTDSKLDNFQTILTGNLALTSSLNDNLDNYNNWITFNTTDQNPTMILGKDDSPVRAILTNEGLEFLYDKEIEPVAYIGAESETDATGKLFVTNASVEKIAVTQNIQIGNWRWYQRGNGNFNLKKIE